MNAKPLFPWLGGKRKLASEIIPLFPAHECYVEPFCGAGALYFFKEPSKVEVLNDINRDVVNLYRVVKLHFEEFYKQFKWVLSSRDQFTWLQQTPPDTMTDIQRAARFLYLQKLAFGGRVQGQTFGTATTARPSFNLLTLEQDLQNVHFRLNGTTIENRDWKAIISMYDRPHTLFYCDPPYYETEGYGVEFALEEYQALAELAETIQGRMIISINGHPKMREVFGKLPMKEIEYAYTVGGGDAPAPCIELVVGNWPEGVPVVRVSQGGLFDG